MSNRHEIVKYIPPPCFIQKEYGSRPEKSRHNSVYSVTQNLPFSNPIEWPEGFGSSNLSSKLPTAPIRMLLRTCKDTYTKLSLISFVQKSLPTYLGRDLLKIGLCRVLLRMSTAQMNFSHTLGMKSEDGFKQNSPTFWSSLSFTVFIQHEIKRIYSPSPQLACHPWLVAPVITHNVISIRPRQLNLKTNNRTQQPPQ